MLDVLEFVLVSCLVLVGLLGCAIVYRNEARRKLRQRFRQVLEERISSTDELEEELARQIGSAIETHELAELEKVPLAPYLEDYIVDFDFKKNLYRFLLNDVRERQLSLSADEAVRIDEAMNIWGEQKDKILSDVDEALKDSYDNISVQAFMRMRPQYMVDKTTHFLEDVREVVTAVVSKRKTY